MADYLPKDLLSWSFAAVVAWTLLKWVTVKINSQLAEIGDAISAQALVNLELYRLFLIHDAQTRGVSINPDDEMSASHRLAYDEYQKINESLSNLKDKLKCP
jgi:hypothetical protein